MTKRDVETNALEDSGPTTIAFRKSGFSPVTDDGGTFWNWNLLWNRLQLANA